MFSTAASTSSNISQPFGKRSACDRCKARKLRCPQGLPCARCESAGLYVTVTAKPLGRLRKETGDSDKPKSYKLLPPRLGGPSPSSSRRKPKRRADTETLNTSMQNPGPAAPVQLHTTFQVAGSPSLTTTSPMRVDGDIVLFEADCLPDDGGMVLDPLCIYPEDLAYLSRHSPTRQLGFLPAHIQ